MKEIEGNFKDKKNRIIEKSQYKEKEKELFVNDSLYFKEVSKEVWEYKIGGYQVLDKYLKSHKNEEIDSKHFIAIIQSLYESLELEKQISRIELFDENADL